MCEKRKSRSMQVEKLAIILSPQSATNCPTSLIQSMIKTLREQETYQFPWRLVKHATKHCICMIFLLNLTQLYAMLKSFDPRFVKNCQDYCQHLMAH